MGAYYLTINAFFKLSSLFMMAILESVNINDLINFFKAFSGALFMNSILHISNLTNYLQVKVLLCFMVLMMGFIKNGNCQAKHNDFEDRSFLLAINRPADSLAYKFLHMTYSEVFRRMEIPFELLYRPLKRGAHDAGSGSYDGEVARVFAYQASHPTLIRVEEFLYSTDVSAFATTSFRGNLDGWKSLKGSDYKVEYPRGVLISEMNLKPIIAPENLSTINNAKQGLNKLLRNRTNIYIDDDLVIFPLLSELSEDNDNKIQKVGIMQSIPLYMYIHKKNHLLAPRLSEVIKEMKAQGLIMQYRKIVFNF